MDDSLTLWRYGELLPVGSEARTRTCDDRALRSGANSRAVSKREWCGWPSLAVHLVKSLLAAAYLREFSKQHGHRGDQIVLC